MHEKDAAMYIDFVELSNFRKLKRTRVSISGETTVFVGANNSGKTSAMVALRYFLLEKERSNFSFNDFTLCHRPRIEAMGKSWEEAKGLGEELPPPDWSEVLPCLDVWLHSHKNEAHFVQKIIPTLDWEGGLLGVRLKLEPKDALQLQKDYLAAREEAQKIEEADLKVREGEGRVEKEPVLLWPRNLPDFLKRRFRSIFTVKSYILDPDKIVTPEYGEAKPQLLTENAVPLESEPFKGLIRIDEISAQRGFGHDDGMREDDEESASGSVATRRMSEQLRRYWNKHLDPFDSPDPKDVGALRAIEEAQQAFDARLREGFASALQEVEGLGYPGVTDPSLRISTQLKPVDGLNHETALQYMIKLEDGETSLELDLPEGSNGLGYQNLISMIFRLMSFRDAWMRVGKASTKKEIGGEALIPPLHLVLIEEPEAHLHTQVQQVFIRQAYKVLRKHPELKESLDLKTQLVVSTHSSHIAHECDFDQLRYFRRMPASENMVPLSCVVNLKDVFGTDLDTKRFVTRYLKVTHCDLFFADAAVFVEGPAERILVPYFVRNHADLSVLDESYITWLDIGGSHAHRLRPLVEHLGLITLIITDLDAKDSEGKKALPQRAVGLKTRNKTLASWCPGVDDFDDLLDLTQDEKVKRYEVERFSVCAAYQSPVKIEFKGMAAEVPFNTLEDALVMENLPLFSKYAGTGLWRKFKSAIDTSSDIAELSSNILNALDDGGKAEFSLSLLELENPKELSPPTYIFEGLQWLSAQLRARQRDLGGASSDKAPELQETVGK